MATDTTISRTTTVSAAVFHGVAAGEHPRTTTMWLTLGDPKFSIAVPCWADCERLDAAVGGGQGAAIDSIARTLRGWNLAPEGDGVETRHLESIWSDVLPVEDRIAAEVDALRQAWAATPPDAARLTATHEQLAAVAIDAMRRELAEMKQAALDRPAPPPPAGLTATNVAASERSAITKPGLRIAIHDDAATAGRGPSDLLRCLAGPGFSPRRITSEEIRRGGLADVDAVVLPGGSGRGQADALGRPGRDAIRTFVRDGGGYVGICAGAYLASSHYDWSLDLINARVWDRTHWARGGGEVSLRMTDDGWRLLGRGGRVPVHYHQGPLLVPDDDPLLPGYEVLASFDTEVARNGAQPGSMTGTHAIIRSTYGAGRVICYSPHPEAADGPTAIITAGIAWAATRSAD